jgi:hypothetical protein
VIHRHVVAVPDGRACLWGKIAVFHLQAINVPQGISAMKLTIVAFYPTTLFDGRFTIGHRHILQS